jgi:photosystem II stability/assembly factor-like uncharacterized protein
MISQDLRLDAMKRRQLNRPRLSSSVFGAVAGYATNVALISILLFAVGFSSSPAAADNSIAREPQPKSWQTDAELTDVFFLNESLGWAVGENGTVIRTRDGGQTWADKVHASAYRKDTVSLEQKFRDLESGRQTAATGVVGRQQQLNSVTCRFNSIHFVDAENGWIAGGYQLPYINRTQAVVMRTRDGGATWESIDGLTIPRLQKIRFDNTRQGIAIGDAGNLYASGIYQTNNGGQSWSARSNQASPGWKDAARILDGFVTINKRGQLGHVRKGQYEPSVLLGGTAEQKADVFRQLAMLNDKIGYAVGENGAVVRTANSGLSWTALDYADQHSHLTGVDWATLTVVGNKVWIAGNPGSVLVSIDQQTNQLAVHRSPVQTKINRITFADAKHGWAVGEFGVILQTDDGGKKWQLQRGNTRGLAMMMVAPSADQIPTDMLAQYACEENRTCGVVVLADTPQRQETARQAVSRLGGCTFRATRSQANAKLPVESNRAGGIGAIDRQQIIAKLVREIRTLRPAVIVSQAKQLFGSEAEHTDWFQLVQEAVSQAANSAAFPNQLSGLNLKPHSVTRFAVCDPIGSVSVNGQQLLVNSAQQVQDKVTLSRSLLGLPSFAAEPNRYRVVELSGRRRGGSSEQNLLAGLSSKLKPLRLGRVSRQGSLQAIKFANRSSSELESFAKFEIKRAQDFTVWRQKLNSYLNAAEVDVHTGGSWMMRLTEMYIDQGKLELAAQSAEILISRFPNCPYSLAVATWLAKHYTSHEQAMLAIADQVGFGLLKQNGKLSKASRIANQYAVVPQRATADGVTTTTWTPSEQLKARSLNPPSDRVKLAAADETVTAEQIPEFIKLRLRKAAQLMSIVGQRDPDFAAGVYCQWLEVRLASRLDQLSDVAISSLESRFEKLAKPVDLNQYSAEGASLRQGLSRRSANELRILDSQSSPTGQLTCTVFPSRPNLDGRLDDSVWSSAATVDPRRSSVSTQASPAQVHFGHDDENLYIAIIASKIPGLNYSTTAGSDRTRDADLSHRDRVVVALDLDRDGQSSFRFEVDHRGWAGEGCSIDSNRTIKGWDPTWFIAQSETQSSWTVEAAIPLDQLTTGRLGQDDVWGVDVVRMTETNPKQTSSVFQASEIPADRWQLKFQNPIAE